MGTKIDIISGFLGAGKTTLIKKLLQEALTGEKIVLIENEFGEIGIDGSLLKDYGIEIKEMNAGCICCTITGDFSRALKEVLKLYKPDRVLIEPSGVGKLSDVVKACSPFLKDETALLNMCIVVLDGLKYKMYLKNFAEFYKDQIRNAKTIILSRTQHMDSEAVDFVLKDIKKYNPKANFITTDWKLLDGEKILELGEGRETAKLEAELKKSINSRNLKVSDPFRKIGLHSELKKSFENHSAEEVFSVWGIETAKTFTKNKLEYILNHLTTMEGFILRAKGMVKSDKEGWLQFDYVPGEVTIREAPPDYTGRICVIGERINKKKLQELFEV